MRVDHQQTQGILRRLAARLALIAGEAAAGDWRQLRPTAPFADVLQMRHEAAHVRLFMS
jgi:urease accessory protein UreF